MLSLQIADFNYFAYCYVVLLCSWHSPARDESISTIRDGTSTGKEQRKDKNKSTGQRQWQVIGA